MTRSWLTGLFFLISAFILVWTTLPPGTVEEPPRPIAFLRADRAWADSVMARLSLEEKLGQLVFVQLQGQEGSLETPKDIPEWEVDPGGFIFSGWRIQSLSKQITLAKEQANVPLLMGLRSDPRNRGLLQSGPSIKLAALSDNQLMPSLGNGMARQANQLGIHLYFTPSLARFYTSETYRTYVDRASQLGQQLEEVGILNVMSGVLPYVPAIGDSSLQDSFLLPYRRLNSRGLSAWELGPRPKPSYRGYPPPLSALRGNRFQFRGLVFAPISDDPRDLGVAIRSAIRKGGQYFEVSPAQAGKMGEVLEDLLRTGDLDLEEVNQWVYTLLLAKFWAFQQKEDQGALPALDSTQREFLARAYAHEAILLVRDPERHFPINIQDIENPYILDMGEETPHFQAAMQPYGTVGRSHLAIDRQGIRVAIPFKKLRYADPVILTFKGLEGSEIRSETFQAGLSELMSGHRVLGVSFLPDSLLPYFPSELSLMQVFEEDSLSQLLAGQAVWGGISPKGQLPRTLSPDLAQGMHLSYLSTRLAYAPPLAGGFDPEKLKYLDTLVEQAIGAHAMPGCQLLVARKGQIVWNKAYGYHTYARRRSVSMEDVYDIASITKVLATTLACMYMKDQKKLDLDTPLRRIFRQTRARIDTAFVEDTLWQMIAPTLAASNDTSQGIVLDSLPVTPDSQMIIVRRAIGSAFISSPVFDLTLRELLSHHSGLPANMPVLPYLTYRKRGLPRFGNYYQPRPSANYSIQVAENFYLRNDILDSIWDQTKLMPVDPEKEYLYSDANLVLVQRAIDSLNGYGIDSLLEKVLYGPLRLDHTGFRPRRWTRTRHIIPTESDQKWRQQLIRGHVHDETSALFGGVSGNAGLFSRTEDMAHLLQMLLNEGNYGGQQLLRKSTVRTFTRRQAGHRGYGFDLKPLDGPYIGSEYASQETFGHTGFTGTCFWVDPEEELIFIFLSNRVHPRRSNWYLSELRVRQALHDLIYSSILPEAEAPL